MPPLLLLAQTIKFLFHCLKFSFSIEHLQHPGVIGEDLNQSYLIIARF